MANLRIFTDSGLDYIHQNMTELYETMKKNPDNSGWLKTFCKKDPTFASQYDLDFKFEINDLNPKEGELNNAIHLYETFQKNNIGDAVIYTEKFLAGFLFSYGYEYFVWSTGLKEETRVSGTLFFDRRQGLRQAIARNVVSRLYRTVKMTVDPNRDDKYELTRFVFDNPALRRMIYYPNLDGKLSRFAFIEAFVKWKMEHPDQTITTKLFETVRLHYSFFCNTNLVDNLDREYVLNYLGDYLNALTVEM